MLRDPLPVFSAGGPCEQFCPLFDVVHPAFPLPTTASPALQGALKDGFGEAVVVCNMPAPCKFLSLDSCHRRFLRTRKLILLHTQLFCAPSRRYRELSSCTHFQRLESFFSRSRKQGPSVTARENDGGDKRLVELQLACEADGVAPPDPVESVHCCHC